MTDEGAPLDEIDSKPTAETIQTATTAMPTIVTPILTSAILYPTDLARPSRDDRNVSPSPFYLDSCSLPSRRCMNCRRLQRLPHLMSADHHQSHAERPSSSPYSACSCTLHYHSASSRVYAAGSCCAAKLSLFVSNDRNNNNHRHTGSASPVEQSSFTACSLAKPVHPITSATTSFTANHQNVS
jgi:hypothetical protein